MTSAQLQRAALIAGSEECDCSASIVGDVPPEAHERLARRPTRAV